MTIAAYRFVRRVFWASALAMAILLLSTAAVEAAGQAAAPLATPAESLSSLQDQCLSRAERSTNPDRMKAICIGWVVLALESSDVRAAKASALRDACVREVRFGAETRIRESTEIGEELCRALHATVAK